MKLVDVLVPASLSSADIMLIETHANLLTFVPVFTVLPDICKILVGIPILFSDACMMLAVVHVIFPHACMMLLEAGIFTGAWMVVIAVVLVLLIFRDAGMVVVSAHVS